MAKKIKSDNPLLGLACWNNRSVNCYKHYKKWSVILLKKSNNQITDIADLTDLTDQVPTYGHRTVKLL